MEIFKLTMVATSSNHSKVITIHESSRECIWLRIDDSTYPRIMSTLLSKTTWQHYLKIMPHALYKSNEFISKEIELNTFLQSSFIHMNSRRVVKSMFNKYA